MLLSIEWQKLKRYRTFWVLLSFFIVLLPLWNYLIAANILVIGPRNINILNTSYSFPQVWSNTGFWGSWFVLFLSILIITVTCNEYTFRTHRQNVIDGWSRLSFYHAKTALVLALSVAATLILYIVGAVFGLIAGGDSGGLFHHLKDVGYFFLLTLNYLGAALLLAMLIRRSGLAISLFLLYVMFLENIAVVLLRHTTHTRYGTLLPLQASDELLPFPLMKQASEMMKDGIQPIPDYAYVLTTLSWIMVYYFAGRMIILKRDL